MIQIALCPMKSVHINWGQAYEMYFTSPIIRLLWDNSDDPYAFFLLKTVRCHEGEHPQGGQFPWCHTILVEKTGRLAK